MAGRLAGKVAIVTGAGGGIGEAIARRFAAEGARVLVVDIEGGDAVARSIGQSAVAWHCDVADRAQCEGAIARSLECFGRLDILVNNAGVSGGSTPFHLITEATWDRVMSINVRGAFLMLQATIAHMLAAGGGAIVNTCSIGSFRATAGAGAYITSKGGLLMMTRQAALEYAAADIRVNAVCPGTIETEMVRRAPQHVLDEIIAMTPMGRLGRCEEIANAVLFLASDEASFVTGEALVVDGGRNAG